MKNRKLSSETLNLFLICALIGLFPTVVTVQAQTVEVVGSATTTNTVRVPVINDVGHVFYVNGNSNVIGIPGTPILRTFIAAATIQSPGAGDPVPYVLNSNGTVTYITSTTFFESNLTQRLTVAQGNTQAAGFGDPLIKYGQLSVPTSVSGIFDYALAPDDTVAFRAEITSNNTFSSKIAVYVGPVTNISLIMDSYHATPGMAGYALNNQGYHHVVRNRNGLSLFAGLASSGGDNAAGIWLHDSVNGVRLAVAASPLIGTGVPGSPGATFHTLEGGISHWPAIDDEGRIAFIGHSPFSGNDGVYGGFEGSLNPIAYKGLAVPGIAGTQFDLFGGSPPIRMGSGGKMVFVGTITGAGVNSTNNKVLVIGSSPADLKVLARAGTQAPGVPAGVVWKPLIIDSSASTENVFYPINDQVVMFGNNRVAIVGQVTGPGITNSPSSTANDSGIWVTDDNGDLALLTRRGSPLTTTTGTVTPTNYFALQGGSGRDGKPSGGNRIGQIAFANGVTTYRASYPVPVPLALNAPILVSGQVRLTFATANDGLTYTLQASTNLTSTNWSDVQSYAGDGNTKTNNVLPTNALSYFRLFRH